MNVAMSGQKLFSVIAGNRLSVIDMRFNEVLDSRTIDRKIASVCAVVPNGLSNRPGAWLLLENGTLEKWELRGGELAKSTSISLKPVFNESRPMMTAGKQRVASVASGQIQIATVLEAAKKAGSIQTVPVDGPVLAMRFSDDDSKLLAIVGTKAILFNAADGSVVLKTPVPDLSANLAASASATISEDLSTIFLVQDGVIRSIGINDNRKGGQYWASIPQPLVAVVADNKNLLGLTVGPTSQAVLFSIEDMIRDEVKPRLAGEENQGSNLIENGGLQSEAEANQPYEIARSPKLAGNILAVQSLPENRIAFLTSVNGKSKVAIATWENGWKFVPLKIGSAIKATGFCVSNDVSKVLVYEDDVIQAWTIDDIKSGDASFVSESVAHTEKITAAKFSNNGQRIISGDRTGDVNVTRFENGTLTGGVTGFQTSIIDIIPRSEEGFVVMDRKGIARGSGNTTRDKITSFGTTINGAASMSNSGNRIAYYNGSEVRIADVRSEKVIGNVKLKNRPNFIRFSNNLQFVLLQDGQTISVWDWRKGERIRVFRHRTRPNTATASFAISENDSSVIVVAGDAMNQISVFEMPDSK